MTATINGKAWSGTGYGSTKDQLNNLQFGGVAGTDRIIMGVSPSITRTGTYPFANYPFAGDSVEVTYISPDGMSYDEDLSGFLTLTSWNSTNIQGTFYFSNRSNFKGDTAIITNGKFNINLQ